MSTYRYFSNAEMEVGRVFVDATAYFVLEESGDSEDECHNGGGVKVETAAAAEDEDAQSCCSYVFISDNMGIQEEDYADCCEERINSGSDDEGEEGVVDQCEVAKGLNKSKTCEGSIVDERERDRLFWEACLAS